MSKRIYLTPQIKKVNLYHTGYVLLAGSGVMSSRGSRYDIGYGGVDDDGDLDPD